MSVYHLFQPLKGTNGRSDEPLEISGYVPGAFQPLKGTNGRSDLALGTTVAMGTLGFNPSKEPTAVLTKPH